jgi:hypothetical protein
MPMALQTSGAATRKSRRSVDPSRSDSAFLIEGEPFAQEQILGRERGFRAQTARQKANQIGKQVQPKQAGFHDPSLSSVFDFLPPIWSLFSGFKAAL